MNKQLTDIPLSPLQTRAQHVGLQVHWEDAQGRARTVDDEVLALMLEKLPVDEATRVPALIAVPAEQPCQLPATLLDAHISTAPYTLTLENGHVRQGTLHRDGAIWLESPVPCGYHRLTLNAGEHAVDTVLAAAPPRCYSVADALRDAELPSDVRPWGLGVQLYSLRGHGQHERHERVSGIGDVGTLATLCEAAAAHGAAAVAVNPMHAGFAAHPERYSPYAPSSRLFLNPLYADPALVLGEDAWHAAVQSTGVGARLAQLDAAPTIDWPAVAEIRNTLMRWLFAHRDRVLTPHAHIAFTTFLQEGAEHGNALLAHACFEALQKAAQQAGAPETWPPADCWTDANVLHHHASEIDYHLFAQWLIDAGLAQVQARARSAGMPIGLIADLAVGTDARGSHAWWRRAEILEDITVGAPPDQLNPLGQNWGITALSPTGMARHGYRAFLEILRAALRHAGGLRIDHALGLARMWLVPDGLPPERGVYLRYPSETLLRLIALESWRHRAVIIGENLGTVPESFETARREVGMLGIGVLWFQRASSDLQPAPDAEPAAVTTPAQVAHETSPASVRLLAPDAWSDDAIATTSTHDLPTVAGWWEGRDIAWRVRLGLLAEDESEASLQQLRTQERLALWQLLVKTGSVPNNLPLPTRAPLAAILALLGQAPGPLRMLPLEDLLGLPEQPNLPGTVDVHPNWCQRVPVSVHTLFRSTIVHAHIAALRSGNTESSS